MEALAQKGTYKQGKIQVKNNKKTLKAKCIYKVPDGMTEAEFTIGFDMETKGFKVRLDGLFYSGWFPYLLAVLLFPF